MDTNTPAPHVVEHDAGDGHIFVGAALMLLGVAILVDQADWLKWSLSVRLWPFVLMFLGLVRLVAPGTKRGRPRPRRTAVWLLSIGLWGLISEFRLFGLNYATSWPLLVVAAGLNMVLKSMETPTRARHMREN